MSSDFTKFAPICFLYERNTVDSKRISSDLQTDFFENINSDSDEWLDFNGLSDVIYRFSNFR